MDKLRRIVGNTLISLLGQIVTWTSTLILTIAYGRFLGDTKFGELFLAITFVALVGFPLEFGFNQQLTRDVAQKPHEAKRYLSNILLIKGCFWVGLYGVIILLAYLLGYNSEELSLVAICGIYLLADAVTNVFASLHYAMERVTFPVVGGILSKGLSALAGTVLLKYGASVQIMACVLLGSSCANMLWQAFWGLRAVGWPFAIDGKLMRELLRTCIPFLVYGVLAVIYYRIDTVLLSLMANATVIGWYGAAYRLLDTLNFLPNLVIFSIMYPLFSKFSVSDETKLKLSAEKSMNFLLFCGMPITTMLIVAAPSIIGFLYHQPQFMHSVPVLQTLAPGLLFLYANTALGSVIMSIKQEKKITVMAAIALVFNIGLNLLLIPRYEHIGAAAATSLTEFLLFCLSIYFTPRKYLPFKSLLVGLKSIVACLVMALAIWKLLELNIFIILPVAIITYVASALLIGVIPREDLKALYGALRQKASPSSLASLATQPLAHQEGYETILEGAMLLADEDTIPMKAVYRIQQMQSRLDFIDKDTLPLKAIPKRLPETPTVHLTEDDMETIPMTAVQRKRREAANQPASTQS
ncbi:MAG TPA: flippase [Ktedonobacteraceae bacterium]|nr:flippase [Ktedonobacteraceae bacterium]